LLYALCHGFAQPNKHARYKFCQRVRWCRQLGTLGCVPPSTSNNFFLSASLWSCTNYDCVQTMTAISDVNFFRILCMPQLFKLVPFHFTGKGKKGYRFLSRGVCVLRTTKLFPCRFLPILASNPGDATVRIDGNNLGLFLTFNPEIGSG